MEIGGFESYRRTEKNVEDDLIWELGWSKERTEKEREYARRLGYEKFSTYLEFRVGLLRREHQSRLEQQYQESSRRSRRRAMDEPGRRTLNFILVYLGSRVCIFGTDEPVIPRLNQRIHISEIMIEWALDRESFDLIADHNFLVIDRMPTPMDLFPYGPMPVLILVPDD